MKFKITGEKIFNLFILVVVIYMTLTALKFPFRAKLLPLLIGAPAAVLLAVIVIRSWFIKPEGDAVPLTPEESERQKKMFLYLLLLLGLVLTIGLEFGLAIYLLLFIRFIGKQKWWLAFTLGVGMYLVVFGLFDYALNYRIFKGYLLEMFL